MSRVTDACSTEHDAREQALIAQMQAAPTATLSPFRLILPWSALVADNARFFPAGGRLRLTAKYSRAKTKTAKLAREFWYDREILRGPVQLVARFYFPDRRTRDAGNYRKCLTDALSGIIYADDGQIVDERYFRVGIDRRAARCEVWVAELPPGSGDEPEVGEVKVKRARAKRKSKILSIGA